MINLYTLHNKKEKLDNYKKYNKLIHRVKKGSVLGADYGPILHIIKKSPLIAVDYAIFVLKGRFYEAEPYIMRDKQCAYFYAKHIIKGRWPEAEIK